MYTPPYGGSQPPGLRWVLAVGKGVLGGRVPAAQISSARSACPVSAPVSAPARSACPVSALLQRD